MTSRRVKTSKLPAEESGKTPARQPRRRKQPTTSKTPAKQQQFDNLSQDDYSFTNDTSTNAGSISEGKKMSGSRPKSSSSSSGSSRGSKKSSPTKSNEKENSSNGKKDGTSTTIKASNANNTNSSTTKAAPIKKKGSTTMDELNNSMAQISLATNNSSNTNDSGAPSTKIISEYIPIPFPPPCTTNTIITTIKENDNNKLLTEAIKTITQTTSKSKEITLINKLFTTNKSLVDIISTTSYGGKEVKEGMLVLEENVNKLIDVVKCCLKLLTSTTSSSSSKDKSKDKSKAKKKDSKLDIALLRLAIHSLRSVISTLQLDNNSTLQVIIKLFYHCIVISGDSCHDLYSTLSTVVGNEGKKIVVEYAILCLGAYEGLSNCLQLVLSGGGKNNKVPKKKSSGVVWDELIPISTLTDSGKSSSKNTSQQQQQYIKIIMESGLCISSSLLYLSLVSMHGGGSTKQQKGLTITNEFHFVNNTLHETTSGKYKESQPTFNKVMKSVVLPCMIHSLCSAEGSDSDKKMGGSFNVDALRHVKKAFRLLWDGARHVEDIISTSSIKNDESAELLRMSCLELQSEGIQFITQVLNIIYTKYLSLLTNKKSTSSSAGGIKELFALFDRAASSSMKSVGIFEKSTGIFTSSSSNNKSNCNDEKKKSALLHFHRVVGDELDGVAMHLSSSTLPASYYEYCVYRSIHQWRLTSSIDTRQRVPIVDISKQAKRSSSESIELAVSSLTYSIVQLVLEARYRLQSHDHKELPNEEEDCERIISNFESIIINNTNCSPTSLNRCRSMLMMLNLQREATGLIASTQQQSSQTRKGSSIGILASVLGQCLAPLEYKLSRLTKDQSRSLNFRLSYADCCAKSASLYDIAAAMLPDNDKDEESYTAKADLQLSKAYEILVKELGRLDKDGVDRKAPSIVAIEMFAKAATFVGKRRSDRKENQASIQPLILASEIMTKVAIKAEGKELFTSYQTSSRFMYLSSALDANNNNVQSCAALAMAAWCAIESLVISSDEERPEGDSTAEEILLFPDSTVLSVRSETDIATDMLSPIIKRLVRAYIQCKSPSKKESSQVDDDDGSLSSTINNTLMGKILSVATSSASDENGVMDIRLSKLLHCAVWNQTRYENELSASQIADVIREVLKSTMKIMKSNLPNDEDDKLYFHLIDELKVFIHAQTKRLGDVIDVELLQVISSSLHITFTSHFIDLRLLYFSRHSSWVLCKSPLTKKKREYKLLKESCLQIQQAEEKFADSFEGQSVQDLCFFTQWAAVQLHHAIIKEHLYLAKLSEASESSRVQYRSKQTTNYIQTLGTCRLAVDQLCEAEEEEVYSAVVESLISTLKRLLGWFTYHSDTVSATECFVLLQKVYSFVEQTEHPLDVASSFLLVSAKFDDMVTLFNEHMDGVDVSSDDPQVNSMLQCSNLLSQTVNPDRSSELIVDLNGSLHQVSRCIESEMEVESETNDEEESTCPNDMIQKRLFITMMLMLHSKLSLDAGRPTDAIKYLDWCRNQCRELVRYMRSVKSYSNSLSMDDIAIQVDDMLTTCYEQSAVAFCLLGIRRKAEDCALLAVLKQKVVTTEKFALINLQDLIKLISQYPRNESILCPIRSLLKVKALSLSEDKMGDTLVDSVDCEVLDGDEFIHMLSKSKNILAYDDSFSSCLPSYAPKSHTYITQVYKQLKKCTSQEDANTNVPLSYFTRRVGAELKLRRYRNSSDNSISTIMAEITASKYGSGICNAEAYYHLGLIELRKARDNGELQALWNDHAIDSGEASLGLGDSNLLEARKLFHYALSEAPPASHKITKNILRCLALMTGPKDGQTTPGLTAASLIHISVGGTSRNIVSDAFKGGKVHDSFQAFDDESLDHGARVQSVGQLLLDSASLLPSSWNIATIVTCPTGDLLISSLRVSTSSSGEKTVHIETTCIFPGSCENNKDEIGIQGDVLTPLDQIIERSQKQLHGITEEVQEQLNEESSKRKWWKKRHSIDEDLQTLLRYAEKAYFGHDLIRQRLIPDELFGRNEIINNSYGNDDDDSSECSYLGPSKLFETTDCDASVAIECASFDKESERSELTKLTVAVIKSKLATFDIAEKDFKKMRKTELIELLLSKMEDGFNGSELEKASSRHIESPNDVEEGQSSDEPCTILVLDEHLLRFPFESMDIMSNKAVTRVPCLSFVLATLLETKVLHSSTIPMADPRKVKYVLDPESNLAESASTLGSALNLIASNNGWTWEGVVGEMPPSEFMQEALTEENGLYLYCGHGGGEKAYSRSQVEDLMTEREDGIRGCRAPVVLMGCSSGKLKSVNTPNDPTTRQHDKKMHYEPEGIALSYLYAGAPCVVGNLWDVTDRDIDRYCLTLVEDFLLPSQNGDTAPSHSLAKCVAKARRACKLRYIVGSAPVCYGVPVITP